MQVLVLVQVGVEERLKQAAQKLVEYLVPLYFIIYIIHIY